MASGAAYSLTYFRSLSDLRKKSVHLYFHFVDVVRRYRDGRWYLCVCKASKARTCHTVTTTVKRQHYTRMNSKEKENEEEEEESREKKYTFQAIGWEPEHTRMNEKNKNKNKTNMQNARSLTWAGVSLFSVRGTISVSLLVVVPLLRCPCLVYTYYKCYDGFNLHIAACFPSMNVYIISLRRRSIIAI